jgi:hypothetical protein
MTDFAKAREAAADAMCRADTGQSLETFRRQPFERNPDWYVEAIDAALSAFEAAGFVLVPREYTPEMEAAGHAAYERELLRSRHHVDSAFKARWSAMIAAAIAERQK